MLYIGVVMDIRRNTYFSYGSFVFMLGGLGGVLHTGKYTNVTLLLVGVIRGTREVNANRATLFTKWGF